MAALHAIDHRALDDVECARLAGSGKAAAARGLTTRQNQRLYRTAFSILKDLADAEEAVQDAYLKAFGALGGIQDIPPSQAAKPSDAQCCGPSGAEAEVW